MSSGVGLNGKVGKCFHFFKSTVECLKTAEDDQREALCRPIRDDYLECLHGFKDREKKQALIDAYEAQKEEVLRDRARRGIVPGSGQV